MIAPFNNVEAALAQSRVFGDVTREAIPAALTGQDLQPFIGQPIDNLALMANRGKGLEPIPFQVDERDAQGRYVYPNGGDAQDEQPGILDATDEFVFLLEDAGFRTHKGLWPRVVHEGREVELDDTKDKRLIGARGFVYLFVYPASPPRSNVKYVHYNSEDDITESDWTKIGYLKGNPYVMNRVMVRTAPGAPFTENLVDRLKVRTTAYGLGEWVKRDFDEESFPSTLTGWKAGPVRVLRHVNVNAKMPLMPEVPFDLDYLFTPKLLQVPATFSVPVRISDVMSRLDLVLGIDFRDMVGAEFSTLELDEGTLIDGQVSPAERNVPLGSEEWILIRGKGINLFGVVDLEEGIALTKEVHFHDSRTEARPPEAIPGQLPEIGFRLLNWTNLQPRTYRFIATLAALQAFRGMPRGGGSGFYHAIHTPPAVEVRPGTAPLVVLVHPTGMSVAELDEIETQLATGAPVQFRRLPLSGAARPEDFERVAEMRPNVAVFLTDADPTAARKILNRHGIRALVAPATADAGLNVPVDRVMAMLRQAVPGAGKVLFITGSEKEREFVETYLGAAATMNLNLVHVAADKQPLAQALSAHPDAAAALVLPAGYWKSNNFARLRELTSTLKQRSPAVPVFATSREAVRHGALLGLEYQRGTAAEGWIDQAVTMLAGQAVTAAGGGQARQTTIEFYLNAEVLRESGYRLPLSILKLAHKVEPAS